jgi:sulfatase maturation enzyme AslB (radical SAM superfamily)
MNILIFVVDKCNYKCEYCYNRFPRTLKSADLNLFSKFIKDIKLKTNRKYYVRIRTYKTVYVDGFSQKIFSKWSKAMKVK